MFYPTPEGTRYKTHEISKELKAAQFLLPDSIPTLTCHLIANFVPVTGLNSDFFKSGIRSLGGIINGVWLYIRVGSVDPARIQAFRDLNFPAEAVGAIISEVPLQWISQLPTHHLPDNKLRGLFGLNPPIPIRPWQLFIDAPHQRPWFPDPEGYNCVFSTTEQGVLIEPGCEGFDPDIHFPGDVLRRLSGMKLYFGPTEDPALPFPENVLPFDPDELPFIRMMKVYGLRHFITTEVQKTTIHLKQVSDFVTPDVYRAIRDEFAHPDRPINSQILSDIQAACRHFGMGRIVDEPSYTPTLRSPSSA
jgi:hypothetical protein